MPDLIKDLMLGAIVAGLLAATLLALGERIRVRLRWPCRPSIRPVVAWCLGSWTLGTSVLVLGLLGGFRSIPLLGAFVIAVACGHWTRLPGLVRSLGWFLLAAVPLLPVALAPPFFYDSWVYHLGLPWQALAGGELTAQPGNLFSTFPPLAQMLYALPLALDVPRAPALVHLIGFCVAASALTSLARTAGAGRLPGTLAGAALLYLPVTPLIPAFPAAEAWTVCGVVGSLALAVSGGRSVKTGARAGWLAGVAAASRLQGLPWAAVTAGALVLRGPRRIAAAIAFAGAAVLGAIPWWGKNAVLPGPMLAPLGRTSEGIDTLWRDGVSNLNLATGPVDLAYRVGQGVTAHGWLLLSLAVAGGLALLASRQRARIVVMAAGWAGVLMWALTGALGRFLVPSLALLLAGAVSARRRTGLAAALLALICVLVPGVRNTVAMYGRIGGLDMTRTADDVYASLLVSNPYPGFLACAELPDTAHVLLVAEPRGFLFPRSFETASQHDRSILADVLERHEEPSAVVRELRGRGFTHVLVNVAEMSRLGSRYPVLPWRDEAVGKRFVEWTRFLEPPAVFEGNVVVYELRREGGS